MESSFPDACASSGGACPEGLEPPTCCLEGSCSIQLSYGQTKKTGQQKDGNPASRAFRQGGNRQAVLLPNDKSQRQMPRP
jgi:hypothetical protein